MRAAQRPRFLKMAEFGYKSSLFKQPKQSARLQSESLLIPIYSQNFIGRNYVSC